MHFSPNSKCCCALLCALLSFPLFSQTHRYVDPTGSDAADCSSPGSPCQTIDFAVSQAVANDVLNLTVGTFSSTTLSTPVVLSGRGAETIVQGITINAATDAMNPVSIENLTVSSLGANGITISTSYVNLFNVNSSGHSSRNVNIDASSAILNIEISNCVLDGGNNGIVISDQTDLNGLTILNTTMNSNTIGFYSSLGNSSTMDKRVSNVLIRNCTFNNNSRKGIYAEKLEDAVFENITIDNSGTDATYGFNNGIDINLKWQAYSNITIRNSRVINSGAIGSNDIGTAPENRRSSAITIKARTDASSYNGTPASLTNVTLDGVIIDGLVTDLRFGEMGKTDNDGIDMSSVIVQHCSFANDNLAGLLNEENMNTLALANNYWGGSAPTGTDIVDYGASAVTSQSGELANEIVDALNTSYATVAAALSAGGTIQNLPAGTVSGTSLINMDVTLISPGAGNLDPSSLTTFETLNVNGASLTLGSDLAVSTNLNIGPPRDLVLGNYNLLLSGTVSSSGEVTGSSTSGLYISGSGALGTIAFTSGSRELERLNLNRTSSGTVTLGSDLNVASISLTNGLLSTGANNLNFTGNTALEGNDNSFVNGNFTYVTSGTPIGNTLFFPIGITDYRPIGIEGVDQSATTNYTGTITESTPPSSTSFLGTSILDKLSTTRYWTVTPSVANVTSLDLVTLTYGDEENVSDQANLRVAQFLTSAWYNLGGSGASPISSGASPPNAIVLALGDFALGDELVGGTNFTEIATVFVNASTGDDANDGASSGTPKLTLTAGFSLVQSGGTINIAAGAYGESFEINQPVTIVGTGSPTTTDVTLNADIISSGFESSTVNVNSPGIIQDGIDLASASGVVNVTEGTFGEILTIAKALTLNGANAGIAGNSVSRAVETIVEPSSAGIGATVSSSNVTIDGFQFGTDNSTSNNTTAISSIANTDLSISSNVIFANGVGITIVGASSGTIGVSNNSIEMLNLEDPLNAAVPSFGIVAQSITGTADADLTGNDVQTASYGIFGFALSASATVTINGGSFSGCTKGIEINNTDGTNFSPSTVDILNVVMSSFSGPDADLAQPDTQAGIYAFVTGNAGATDDVIVSIDNADISGIGSGGTDYSGIYIADFQVASPFDGTDDDGIAVTATVSNSNIHDNSNRGIHSRGRNALTTITQSTISGNDAAGGVVFAFGTLNITNSEIINSASGTPDGLLAQNNGTITAQDNSFDVNGNVNGNLADVQSGGTINMSGNWLGSTDETTNTALVDISGVDFTPWIGSGTDTDLVTAGFQPDLSTMYVGTSGTQTGSTGRWQEGHDLVDAAGTVVLAHADYAETVTVSKSLTFQPTTSGTDTSLDNLVMNGLSEVLTLEGNLLINTAVTLTSGIINVNSGELRLGTSVPDIIEMANSRITGLLTMVPRPVGMGSINFLDVNIAAGADDIGNATISRNSGSNSVIPGGVGASIAVVWDITVDAQPAAGRDVTFSWRSELDNSNDVSTISVFRNPGANAWAKFAGPFVAAGDPRSVIVTGVTGFSEWTLAEEGTPLPVELTAFDGQLSHGKVELKWTTFTEINADFFEVQKSQNDHEFAAVGRLNAAGNSDEIRNYRWAGQSYLNSSSFYRLRIVDFDGSFEYSSVVGISPLISDALQVYPNPAADYVNVEPVGGSFNYTLYDQNGRQTQSGISKSGRIDVSVLEPGVYYLKVGKDRLIKVLKR